MSNYELTDEIQIWRTAKCCQVLMHYIKMWQLGGGPSVEDFSVATESVAHFPILLLSLVVVHVCDI